MSDYILRYSSDNVINLPKEYVEKMGWEINDKISMNECSTIINPRARREDSDCELPSLDLMEKTDREILDIDYARGLSKKEWKEQIKTMREKKNESNI